MQRCCRSHPWGISAADGEVAEREALIVEAARAAGSNETLKAQLAQAFAGAYHAHAVGEHLKFLTEHHAQRAHAQAVEAVAQARAGEWESAHSHLRSAAESSLRAARAASTCCCCRARRRRADALVGLGWTCLEYYAHSRGHAALQRAAESVPGGRASARGGGEARGLRGRARGRTARGRARGERAAAGAARVELERGDARRRCRAEPRVVRRRAGPHRQDGGARDLARGVRVGRRAGRGARRGARADGRRRGTSPTRRPTSRCTRSTRSGRGSRACSTSACSLLVASAPAFRALLEPIGGARALRVHDCFVVKYTGARRGRAAEGAARAQGSGSHQLHDRFELCVGLRWCVRGARGANLTGARVHRGWPYFEALDQTVPTDAGHFTAFASTLVHAGVAVTRGTRYVLVLFLYADGWNATAAIPKRSPPSVTRWLTDGETRCRSRPRRQPQQRPRFKRDQRCPWWRTTSSTGRTCLSAKKFTRSPGASHARGARHVFVSCRVESRCSIPTPVCCFPGVGG